MYLQELVIRREPIGRSPTMTMTYDPHNQCNLSQHDGQPGVLINLEFYPVSQSKLLQIADLR